MLRGDYLAGLVNRQEFPRVATAESLEERILFLHTPLLKRLVILES